MANYSAKPKGKSIAEQKAMDSETTVMLYEGASLSQLVALFKQDIRKIKGKIEQFGLKPVKVRSGHPIYSVREVAPYLVTPPFPLEDWVKVMNHADVPKMVSKEFWAGMRSKQIYEEAAGDLWRTEKVIEHISEIFKLVSVQMKLVDDRVEREVKLTGRQREIIRALMDETLNSIHNAIEEMLTKADKDSGDDEDGLDVHTEYEESEDDEL